MTKITKQNVLVTGANGFIGRNLCVFLKEKGYFVRVAVRNNVHDVSGADEYIQVGDINESMDWQEALAGVDTVIHLAARVHIMNDPVANSLEAFRKVNVLGTERLARMAARAGVKRFIFISSVKVNGEGARDWPRPAGLGISSGITPSVTSSPAAPRNNTVTYTENDAPAPQDAYGVSKREAEDKLACISAETGLEMVILRLPLIYGPGVKANFKNLIKIARAGLPLPLKGINNRRSFLYLGNLVDAIVTCITHPLAVGETFMVSDGEDVSTPDLIKMIACAMGNIKSDSHKERDSHFYGHKRRDSHLFYLHPGILKALCKIAGKTEELEKLTGSLIVDSSKIRNLLGWKPPFTMEEGIRETVKGIEIGLGRFVSPATFGGEARND